MGSSHRGICLVRRPLSNHPHPLFPFLMTVKAMYYRQQCQNMNGAWMSKLLFESCLGENCPVTTLLCDPKINLCNVNIFFYSSFFPRQRSAFLSISPKESLFLFCLIWMHITAKIILLKHKLDHNALCLLDFQGFLLHRIKFNSLTRTTRPCIIYSQPFFPILSQTTLSPQLLCLGHLSSFHSFVESELIHIILLFAYSILPLIFALHVANTVSLFGLGLNGTFRKQPSPILYFIGASLF